MSAIYGAVVALRNALYDRDVVRAKKLRWPVVSIGNIRAGGTGKTPFIMALGKLLQEHGVPFGVLSRGYRRRNVNSIKLVEPGGSPVDYGDEPLLISQRLGVPVIVGADRYSAGRFAEERFSGLKPAHGGKWIHLLDDGFQHRRLYRDFDMVLVGPGDAEDSLLPTGRLREPLSSLRRADAVVLIDEAPVAPLPPGLKHLWRARRKVSIPDAPANPVAFCGIAKPERFFADLTQTGLRLAAQRAFPDHHRYSHSDIRDLISLREQNQASGFITTEKDLINLKSLPQDLLRRVQPLRIVSMELELEDPATVLAVILQACAIPQSAETINRPPKRS